MMYNGKSFYGNYIQEREGKHIIENESGFMTYSIVGDECYIENVWIVPEARKSGAATKMMNEIVELAKAKGCKLLTGSVLVSANNSTDSLKVMLASGFGVFQATNNAILFAKEI